MSLSDADMIEFRDATIDDLPAIVGMLGDDVLGARRENLALETLSLENPVIEPYRRAFERIDADPSERLIVGIFHREPVCCAQLSLLPGLSHGGATRAQIEGVRVMSRMRGRGIGHVLIDHLLGEARRAGADIVQLTTDKRRGDAHRFYERLGFEATHLGMKRSL